LPPKTSRVLAWIASCTAAVLLLALLAAAVVFWRPSLLEPFLLRFLTPAGGSASLGGVAISLSPPRVVLQNFQSSHPAGTTLHLKKVRLDFDLASYWGGGPWLDMVEAEGLRLEARPSPAATDQPLDLSNLSLILAVKQARLKNASLMLHASQGLLALELTNLAIEPQTKEQRRLSLMGNGVWSDPAGKRLAWAKFKGSGLLDKAPSLTLGLDLSEGGSAVNQLQGALQGTLQFKLTPERVEAAQISLNIVQGQGRLTPANLQMDGSAGLDGREAVLAIRRLALGRQIHMSGAFKGSLGRGLQGNLEMQGRLILEQAELSNLRLKINLAGSYASPRIDHLEIDLPAGSITWRGANLPFGGLHISGKGALDSGSQFHLTGFATKVDKLGAFKGNLLLDEWRLRSGSLQATALRAAGLLALAQTLGVKTAVGWQAKGKLDLAADLAEDSDGKWQAKLTSSDLGLSSNDGSVLVDGLAGQLKLTGAMNAQPDITAELKLKAGQALWGTVFLDLARAPLELNTQFRLNGWENFRAIKLQGSLAGMGRFSGQGELSLAKGVLRHQGGLQLEDLELTKLFNTFVRDPLSVSLPSLASWQVHGRGRLELQGGGQGGQADVKGRLQIAKAGLTTGQGAQVGSLELDLPFAYRLGKSNSQRPRRPGRLQWGSIKLGQLKMPGLQLKHLELPLAITPNRLWVLGSIEVPLAGGEASISDMEIDEPLSPDFQAHCIAVLKDLNLVQLAGPSLPLQGSLGGRLSEVRLTRQRLRTKGRLEGSLYGGSLAVRGLTMELPFSPGRELGASMEARQVNLEPLSQALKVGRITGRVDAAMRGLRLAYGQPVVFNLKVESVETPGVDQQVSLRAVNSISLLGTGMGLSGLGLGLFAAFFKEFPYEKIAFSCDLKNDVFKVRGLIHEDGVEYLVKRPFFMGINVINRNPDNRISFSDMLERLQRVQQDNAPRSHQAEAKEER
jgi:hypothetical protein